MKFKNTLFPILIFLFVFSSSFAKESSGPVIVMVGTRPEAIKMLPVFEKLKATGKPTILCSTGQHRDMLDEIFSIFNLKPDFDLDVMKPNQDLFHITTDVLNKTKEIFTLVKPSLVLVQGDTTSAVAAGLAAFYLKIPVAHVEAGLRTHDIYAPFPEEMNRQLIGRIASLHFTPTSLASKHLESEGIGKDIIFCTGNTVIDTLFEVREKIKKNEIFPSSYLSNIVEKLKKDQKKLILLTAHRRESFEGGLQKIFSAIKTSLNTHPELTIIYPMHPNPAIKKALEEVFFENHPNLITIPPIPYHDMVYLLDAVDGVATDSGGIQEEAVSLNKMTLVLRNETDRPEGLKDGLGKLVGTNETAIISGIEEILLNNTTPPSQNYYSPYGDGLASKRIVEIIEKALEQ